MENNDTNELASTLHNDRVISADQKTKIAYLPHPRKEEELFLLMQNALSNNRGIQIIDVEWVVLPRMKASITIVTDRGKYSFSREE
jgi:hypothetical protein